MRFFTPCGKRVLTFAMLIVTLFGFGAPGFAQEMEKPGVAVYVGGDIPDNEKKVLASYLLAAIVKSGEGAGAEGADAFLAAAMGEERAKQGGSLSRGRVCELARQFNIRFLCAAAVTPAFGFFVISAEIVETEMEEVLLKGEAQSPLKTIDDLTLASNTIVESMFGVSIPNAQSRPEPGYAPPQSAEPAAGASTAAAVDRVVAAVSAFKDATNKSIAAANTVKAATQSRNFSAIRDAKQKVESAAEAVKKARADVAAAIDAVNSAGPEAGAAVRALGIDLSMFGGSADGEAEEGEGGGEWDRRFYFTPKYQSPVGMPVSWGGVNFEIGWLWRSGFFLGIDAGFGADGDGILVGGGLSLGREYNFRNQMQFAYGGTAGFWYVDYGYNDSYNFLAPFVKYRWNSVEVTYRGLMGVTGGGGFGYNSHQSMVGYYLATKGSRKESDNEKNARFYFAPKYQTPLGAPSSWGGVDAEVGWVWRNGFLLGIDFNYGYSGTDGMSYLKSGLIGGGLSLGKEIGLGNQMKIAVGGSAGFWFVEELEELEKRSLWKYVPVKSYNFLAPFVKWRVSVFEITYRALLGIYYNEYDFYYGSSNSLSGFGLNSHQTMVGFYFGGHKAR